MINKSKSTSSNPIIFFDGECPFCIGWVQWLIRVDQTKKFRFASLQSSFAQQFLPQHILDHLESVVLYEQGKIYTHSTAVLRILKSLSGWWKGLYLFILVPRPLRDAIYSWIAKNRYRFLKQNQHCLLPTESERDRFIDIDDPNDRP